jgi:hypothetical protein
MAVTGLNRPDVRTIAAFRKRHLVALSELFVQVLHLCRAAGLVQFGHVAVDGTKLKANASRHKAMSYGGRRRSNRLWRLFSPGIWWAGLACSPPPSSGRTLIVRDT